ncbi:MAG: Acylamino-acid-releasing enzyme [Hydrogenibacillus schlegelii]|uniref:Acylamino-acid-releasing enzyme n=1 Tax=Hydrogenibacillus schlegelii TaxID=1484 RepID=A0A2T5G3E3_HYDSH|nr:S9 family peptidase [Hydrogenibacillus schlegelii]PTQ50710.1 MAG: Acylamino-acid-releasing enzyme [Hydrogenibacillus schlegelii]
MIRLREPTARHYLGAYAIQTFAVSKDESRLIMSTNLNGAYNLWSFDLSGPRYPYPLTTVGQTASAVAVHPEGHWLFAGFDHDGDENFKFYLLPPDGGEPTPLFPEAKADEKYYYVHLSEDGNRLYYVSSKDNPTFLDGYVYDLTDGSERKLYTGDRGTTFLAAVSPKETSWVVIRSFANTYSIGLVNAPDGLISLVPDPDVVHVTLSPVFIDEESLVFLTDYGSDVVYLAAFSLRDRIFRKVVEVPGISFVGADFHRPSRTLYLLAHRGVEDVLYRLPIDAALSEPDIKTSEDAANDASRPSDRSAAEAKGLERLPLPVGVVEHFVVGESGTLYVLGRSATEVHNIYRLKAGSAWEKLTDNRLPGVPKARLVEPEVVRYTSFDGLEIEALYFRPPADRDNGYTVLWPHGGPQAAERKFFRPLFQLLTGAGYRIFAPNFRGSSGYGSAFMKMVEGDWGEGPRLDVLAGVDWLIDTGRAEREKIFVVGGSYGGYMTLLLHGRHADRFRAFVDIFGVSNLFTFIDSVPPHWKPMMKRWLGDPVEDRERLIKDSPVTYLEQMTKPMLVVQGANDPRVVKAESDQIVEALRQKGVPVEYIVLPDEGHGFSKKANEIKVYTAILEFLERHRDQ